MIARLRFKVRLRFRKISSLEQPISLLQASEVLEPGQAALEGGRDCKKALQTMETGREEIMRSMRLAALAVAMTLAFSGLALARDDHYKDKHVDHHISNHVSNHALDHVWNRNQDQTRSNDRWRESAQERQREHERWVWEHRNNGAYGNSQVYNRYPNSYPDGYPNGGYGYPGTVSGRGGYGNGSSGAGYSQGFQDGSYQARKDVAQGKPFNPNPRGASHSDHGYTSSMGDKYSYQASYNQGYHSGYQSSYGGRGGNRGWGF